MKLQKSQMYEFDTVGQLLRHYQHLILVNLVLAGCHIEKIEGILNGTTNYILSKMNEEDITFEEALKEAQSKGIAETDNIRCKWF